MLVINTISCFCHCIGCTFWGISIYVLTSGQSCSSWNHDRFPSTLSLCYVGLIYIYIILTVWLFLHIHKYMHDRVCDCLPPKSWEWIWKYGDWRAGNSKLLMEELSCVALKDKGQLLLLVIIEAMSSSSHSLLPKTSVDVLYDTYCTQQYLCTITSMFINLNAIQMCKWQFNTAGNHLSATQT